jgi:hypothetical protein
MAKTLKDLKAKLGELQGPEDNTVATKNFYRKHKTVKHPDPAGNGDDVFNASNVRTVNRSPNHGYNPGEDAAVFENAYNNLNMKRIDKSEGPLADRRRRAINKLSRSARSLLDPSQTDRGQKRDMGQNIRDGEYDTEIPKRLQKNSYDPKGNKLDEILGFSKKEKAEKAAKKMMNSGPWKRGMDAKERVDAARYYGTLKQSYDPRISEIFAHLSEENKELFLQVLGEEDGYERIAEAFGFTEEE